MNKVLIFAAVAALTAGAAFVASPAQADAEPRTIRYLSTNPRNTDLDLGKRGLSAGDVQVFLNDAVRGGKKIGYEAGECRIVHVDRIGLIASCHATLVLADGTISAQGVFAEEFARGPRGITAAVTGGTGRYRGASGESVGEFVPGTDTLRMTIRLD
jgi:hypothetical protein